MNRGSRPTDEPGEGYSFEYDPAEDDQPVQAVVEAVAWVRDVGVRDLEPLQRTVDTGALVDLFCERSDDQGGYRTSDEPAADGPELSFAYEGCAVTVAPGRIRIERR